MIVIGASNRSSASSRFNLPLLSTPRSKPTLPSGSRTTLRSSWKTRRLSTLFSSSCKRLPTSKSSTAKPWTVWRRTETRFVCPRYSSFFAPEWAFSFLTLSFSAAYSLALLEMARFRKLSCVWSFAWPRFCSTERSSSFWRRYDAIFDFIEFPYLECRILPYLNLSFESIISHLLTHFFI